MSGSFSEINSCRVYQYAKSVVSGETVAGPHVRNACRRHLDDLKRDDIEWDQAAADRAFRFFEQKLKLSEGQFEGKPLKLEPAQAFIVGSLFGWKKLNGFRRFRRAYIEMGKGNGKSPMMGGIGLYGLMADGENGSQVYAAGATKDQAGVLFQDASKMVRASDWLMDRLKFSGAQGKEYNIAHLKTGSFFRPVSREAKKTGSGPRPHFALVDELHEHPDSGVLEILERGFKFRQQPLLVMCTNSGTDRQSVCFIEHLHAVRVAAGDHNALSHDAPYKGDVIDDDSFSYVTALDPDDDPLEDPTCWAKANPLLGVTIQKDYLAGVVAQARAIPSKLNNILRLHFCVWTDADTAWMTRKALEPVLRSVDREALKGQDVWLGVDLSQVNDLTAVAIAAKTGEKNGKPSYSVWTEVFTPGRTARARADRDGVPYDLWIREGHLNAIDSDRISFRDVAQCIAEISYDYHIVSVAYDSYAFQRGLLPELQELGLDLDLSEHPQGGTKKGKLTDAMKEAAEAREEENPAGLWMPRSVQHLEELIADQRITIDQTPVNISCLMSSTTQSDRWGNYWLSKDLSAQKIDAAVAMCMALGLAEVLDDGVLGGGTPWDRDDSYTLADL
jgi:phage terminase large subunit-like protein